MNERQMNDVKVKCVNALCLWERECGAKCFVCLFFASIVMDKHSPTFHSGPGTNQRQRKFPSQ